MKYLPYGAGLLAALALAGAGRPAPTPPPTTAELETRLLAAIDGVQTLRYTVTAQERVGTTYRPMRSTVKLTPSPLRVYLKNNQGVEVLYVTGQNGGDAWVYPAAFPYVTLSLDPEGGTIMKNQHHSVRDVGYGLISRLLRDGDPAFTRTFRYAGDSVAGGRPCYVLRASYPAFHYSSYRASAGETTASVGAKLHCGEFRILERNKLGVNTKLDAGQVLQVPNAYGSRVTILVDQRTYLPASVAVYDDRGLYERYDFSNVVVNQPLPVAEFRKDFPGYKL